MRRTINGRSYDTETARLVASDSYASPREFIHWSEELYQKRGGEWFLYGEGGPLSKYAVSSGQNEMRGSERITPLTDAEAKRWVEQHANDDYAEIFGEPTLIVAEDWAVVRTIGTSLGVYLTTALRQAGIGPGDRVRVRVEKVDDGDLAS